MAASLKSNGRNTALKAHAHDACSTATFEERPWHEINRRASFPSKQPFFCGTKFFH